MVLLANPMRTRKLCIPLLTSGVLQELRRDTRPTKRHSKQHLRGPLYTSRLARAASENSSSGRPLTADTPAAHSNSLYRFFSGVCQGDALGPLVKVLQNRGAPSPPTHLSEEVHSFSSSPAVPSTFKADENEKERRNDRSYALQAALLLSVEEPKVRSSATQAFLSSSEIQTLAYKRWMTMQGEWIRTQGSCSPPSLSTFSPKAPSSISKLPVTLSSDGGRKRDEASCAPSLSENMDKLFLFSWEKLLPSLLDPLTVSKVLRTRLRESECTWEEALRWLEVTALTPVTVAARIDAGKRVGQWKSALHCMARLPLSEWGEMMVSGTIQSLYTAAREEASRHRSKRAGGTLHDEAEHMVSITRVDEAHKDSASETPSPFVLFACQAAVDVLSTASAVITEWGSPAALNSTLLLFSLLPSLWKEASQLVEQSLLSSDDISSANGTTAMKSSNALTSMAPRKFSRTISESIQACRPLRGLSPNCFTVLTFLRIISSCEVEALDTILPQISRLIDGPHPVRVEADAETIDGLLALCIRSGNKREALKWMERRNEYLRKNSGASAHMQKDSERPPLNRLTRELRERLACLCCKAPTDDTPAHEGPTSPKPVSHAELSKHFNQQTLSRAYNTLLQQSSTVREAEDYRQSLKRLHAVLESESLARLVELNAYEGNWRTALEVFCQLSRDSRRCVGFVMTAALHDTVQFALEQAPAPGASWEVSVRLFMEMTGGVEESERQLTAHHHVPISEVSFQSVVKKCFSEGASSEAQKVFEYLIQRGVRG